MAIELKNQPETEAEYWAAIEDLGGFMWKTNHDLSHGRIQDPTGEISQSVESFRGSLYRLTFPYQCAMISPNYHDWTKDQLNENIRAKGGEPALLRFQAKEVELKAKNSI